MKMKHNIIFCMACTLILSVAVNGKDYYVAPGGSDSNPGSKTRPFAAISRARDAIRAAGIAGTEPITVHLADGYYFLPETLTFTTVDSGSKRFPVVYQAENEEKAIISGAVELGGLTFEPYREGIFKAKITQSIVSNFTFDQLFFGNRMLDMARFPNRDESAPVFNGITNLKTINQRARTYTKPQTGFVHALHRDRWGSVHYRITEYRDGKLQLEGGWQQNRHQQLRQDALMVENVFEELDHPGEWFLDREDLTLYVYPPSGTNIHNTKFYAVNLKNLIHFKAEKSSPVKHIILKGIQFRHARRIFMEDYEGLLRGDWSIHRSGAIFFDGTEHCILSDCFFNQTGGNGVFFNNYNRYSEVIDCRFEHLGESAVCFTGNYECTRGNPIGYNNSYRYDEMDTTPGPRGTDYPRFCRMDGCLVFAIGRTGKQTAGAFISMAENITLSHNTIYHVPRSGITINDGCWGGHLLEHNDVFDTVIETGDHGPFNSWGRDRYWVTKHHSGKGYRQDTVSQHGEVIPQDEARRRSRLDNRTYTVIRNNRWWHGNSHTWGIDLDDGSSHYHVYDNLCLGCSVKLREGFYRRVENNILIGNEGIQLHVPFDYNRDYIAHNIIVLDLPAAYLFSITPISKMLDASLIDENLFWSLAQHFDPNLENHELKRYQAGGIDRNSLNADPMFVDPLNLDFRLHPNSPALQVGFKPFPLDRFGVTKPALKVMAKKAHQQYNTFDPGDYWGQAVRERLQEAVEKQKQARERTYDFLGAKVKDLNSEAEQSTAGVGEIRGVFVLKVPAGSEAAKVGLHEGDAIMEANGKMLTNVKDLLRAISKEKTATLHVIGATDRNITYKPD